MPTYAPDDVAPELVTPTHSDSFGRVISGEDIELCVIRLNKGQGARPHAHEQEQMMYIIKGKMRITIAGQVHEASAGHVVHIPSSALHQVEALEDTDWVSCKNVIGGIGHRHHLAS